MAVRFDAATDRISCTGTVPDPSAGFTLLGWAYVAVDRDDFSTMARLHASSGASTTATFATGSEGVGGPGYFTGGGSVTNSTGFTVGAWRKVAISCTGTTGRCYVATVGGATEADSGTVGGAATPTGVTLGGRSPVDGTEWWNGRLAYWRLYGAELTQSEIETEWASPTPVRTANLWADWPLEVHTDLTDHSGGGHHLTAGSTSTTTEDGPPVAVTVTGTLAVDLPMVVVGAAGTATTGGTSVVDLPAMDAALTGGAQNDGQIAATLPGAEAAAAGGSTTAGQLGTVLPVLDTELTGTPTVVGATTAVLPGLDTELTGTPTVVGATAAVLPGLEAALGGSVTAPVTATLTFTLPALTMASGRTAWPPAVTDASSALVAVDGPYAVPWVAVT